MNRMHGHFVQYTGIVNVLHVSTVQVTLRRHGSIFSVALRARKLCIAVENVKLEIGDSISPSALTLTRFL